jgi:RIO kinase 2
MVDGTGLVTLIDFPQMVSLSHPNAADLLRRDITGLIKFFAMKMHFVPPEGSLFELEDVTRGELRIDEEVKASGFSPEGEDDELAHYEWNTGGDRDGDDEGEEDNECAEGGISDALSGIALTSSALAAAANGPSAVADEAVDGSEGEDDDEEEVDLVEQVKLKLKNNRHDSTIRKSSRNATKKRNKYGRIVKADKMEY